MGGPISGSRFSDFVSSLGEGANKLLANPNFQVGLVTAAEFFNPNLKGAGKSFRELLQAQEAPQLAKDVLGGVKAEATAPVPTASAGVGSEKQILGSGFSLFEPSEEQQTQSPSGMGMALGGVGTSMIQESNLPQEQVSPTGAAFSPSDFSGVKLSDLMQTTASPKVDRAPSTAQSVEDMSMIQTSPEDLAKAVASPSGIIENNSQLTNLNEDFSTRANSLEEFYKSQLNASSAEYSLPRGFSRLGRDLKVDALTKLYKKRLGKDIYEGLSKSDQRMLKSYLEAAFADLGL